VIFPGNFEMERSSFLRALFPAPAHTVGVQQVVFQGKCCFMDPESRRVCFFSPTPQNEDCTELDATITFLNNPEQGDVRKRHRSIWRLIIIFGSLIPSEQNVR
jgi:hypothetical protein